METVTIGTARLATPDGEHFRKYRLLKRRGAKAEADSHFAQLTPTKQRDLARLWKLHTYQDLCEAYDRLLRFRGLWHVKIFANFRRMFCMKCPEVTIPTISNKHSI